MTVAVKNEPPVVVPLAALRRAGFKRGQELEIKSASGVITIVPKAVETANEFTPAQRRAVNRGVMQSLKEYRQGRVAGPFETAAEFLADLHKESAKLDAKKKKRDGR